MPQIMHAWQSECMSRMRYHNKYQSSSRIGTSSPNTSLRHSTLRHQSIGRFRSNIVIFLVAVAFCMASSSTSTSSSSSQQQVLSQKNVSLSTSTSTSRSTSTSTTMADCEDTIHYKVVVDHKNNDSYDSKGGASHTRYAAYCSDNPVSIETWTKRIVKDPHQVEPLVHIIRQSIPYYQAVFFETKGCHVHNWDQKQFEFVLVDAPQLKAFAESNPDPYAFAEFILKDDNDDTKSTSSTTTTTTKDGCAFDNLGRDAKLIAPKPQQQQKTTRNKSSSSLSCYSHLAAFCRHAPHDQVISVWALAVQEFQQRILSSNNNNDNDNNHNHPKSTWFSTAGMGIAWLHFRLDSRPKYYQYTPFKNES